MKPRIGISWLIDPNQVEIEKRSLAYLQAIRNADGKDIYLPLVKNETEANELLNQIDGLVMTGGDDIDPALYEQENLYCGPIDSDRDVSDVILLKCAIQRNLPVLCICRGMQMLNIVCGGSLYQDLPTQHPSNIIHRDPLGQVYVSHPITVIKDSLLYQVISSEQCHYNGWHHQAVKDVGKGLKVTAISEDGVVEAIELEGVDYIYGVQFHPERYTVEQAQDASALFKAFVDYIKKTK